ncbi:MAG: DUF998 domain-containing protein [Pseudonocardiaceae bacterium]|nr:MAG: DUF998 domain-containing protein [Pseudonocardiaceae bacterium]
MARDGVDMGAATTRSLLGWGVVAGPFYLVFGLLLAVTRPGFDLTGHPLSALLLGDAGWLQLLNLVLSGLMTGAAAVGLARALDGRRARWVAGLVGTYALCLVLSAVFPPDPVHGFPPGAPEQASVGGVLHLAFGGIGFLALGSAALVAAPAFTGTAAVASRIAGIVVIAGFVGGAALSSGGAGVAVLWVAVVVGWAWLACACVVVYRAVPHPVSARRAGG